MCDHDLIQPRHLVQACVPGAYLLSTPRDASKDWLRMEHCLTNVTDKMDTAPMLLSQNKFRFLTALQLEDDALALQVRDSPDTSRRHTTATADEGATQSCAPGSLSARRRAHMIAMLDRPSRDRLAPSPEATASPLKQTSPQFKARVRNIAKMARRTGQYGLGLRLLRSVGEDPRKTAQKRRKKRTKRILKTQQVARMQPKPIEIVAPMSPIVSTLRATHAPAGSASPSDGQEGAFDAGVWNSAALMAIHSSF